MDKRHGEFPSTRLNALALSRSSAVPTGSSEQLALPIVAPTLLAKRLGYGHTTDRFKLLVYAAGVKMETVRWGRRLTWRFFTLPEVEAIVARHYWLRGNYVLNRVRFTAAALGSRK